VSLSCFRDEAAALATLERILWPQGPVCPHCGSRERIGTLTGKKVRPGLRYCRHCRKQFRATIGTLFEGSHVPVHKWLQACLLLSAGEARVNAHQLHLYLEVSYKTALSIVRRLARIAEVAAAIGVPSPLPMPRGEWQEPPREWGSQFRDFARFAHRLECDDGARFERLLTIALQRHAAPAPAASRLVQRRRARTRSTIAGAAPR